jgi:excisionase family DNA binding protein
MESEKQKDLLTTKDAAAILGISLRRVRALIEAGKLTAEKYGRDYLIKESDLEPVRERKPGRPSKQKKEQT